jgi:hypothetical protein
MHGAAISCKILFSLFTSKYFPFLNNPKHCLSLSYQVAAQKRQKHFQSAFPSNKLGNSSPRPCSEKKVII